MTDRVARSKDHLAAFCRDETGAFAVLGLFLFLVMAIAGGVVVDITRSEMARRQMQHAADNAVLAAAVIADEAEAEAEARRFLTAAGVPPEDVTIRSVYDPEGNRSIRIEGNASIGTTFMSLVGQEQLAQPVLGAAQSDATSFEIVLVVDVSGSMGEGGKMPKLKAAANAFIDTVFSDNRVEHSISIVPYNSAVNLGSELASRLRLTAEHKLSHCVRFEAAQYHTIGIDAGTVLIRTAHFDRDSKSAAGPGGALPTPHCTQNASNEVLPWSNDVDALRAKVASLVPLGFTSTDLGTRVGAMLLDPSLEGVLSSMADGGQVSPELVGRPSAMDDSAVRKVLVILSDGINNKQYDMAADRKLHPTGAFVHRSSGAGGGLVLRPDESHRSDSECIPGSDGALMVAAGGARSHENCDGSRSRWPGRDQWQLGKQTDVGLAPWWAFPRYADVFLQVARDTDDDGDFDVDDVDLSVWAPSKAQFWLPKEGRYGDEPIGGGDAYELSMQELFAIFPMRYLEGLLKDRIAPSDWERFSAGDNKSAYALGGTMGRGQLDLNLLNVCAAVRLKPIALFTIALESDDHSRGVLRNCVNNEASRFFEGEEDDLDDIFAQIATQITRVRLVE
jgi:Flp pilus assembly protein TadG